MSQSFTDAQGVTRNLKMTIGTARRIKDLHGVDFIDGEVEKICESLMIRKTLLLDLVWTLLENKEQIKETEESKGQDAFEDSHLDGTAYKDAQAALMSVIENFIQTVRPEIASVYTQAISLMSTQITESANNVVSLLQSTEMQEAFSSANADVKKNLKSLIAREFSKLQEPSESTQTP